MCGFLGFIGNGRPIDLAAGAVRIRRRGPDSLGVWRSGNGQVEVHHARLAISDLRPVAAQPISDPSSGQTVAFVGEIYNHLELRAALKGPFQTESDTETLLALFGKHWSDTLPMLRGMFSLCLIDERRREVILARDPVGKKPLFILPSVEGLYFSSSVLALAAASNVFEIDDVAGERWWKLGFCPPHLSLLKGCRPLLPGEMLTVTFDGNVASNQIVHPPIVPEITKISVTDAVDEAERLVRKAVRRRLADNPNPVALLSGGIDSTVVCKFAVEEGATRLLTLAVPALKSSDEAYADEAARRLGVKLECINLEMSQTGRRVAEAVLLQDEPLAIPSFIPLSRLVAKAAIGSRVLLTGDGGDETFGGYGRPETWYEEGDYVADEPEIVSGPPLPEWMSAYARRATGFDLVGHGFAKLDRSSAEQAVEARCPLLDWDLMAFVRSLPRDVIFLKKGVSKPLAKALLRGWPNAFLEREKGGFTYRLRWLWAVALFSGLREMIVPEAIERFRAHLPEPLRQEPNLWSTMVIHKHFNKAFQLYTWSSFLRRLQTTSTQVKSAAASLSTAHATEPSVGGITLAGKWVRGTARRLLGIGANCPSCGDKDCQMVERLSVASALYRCRACRLQFNLPSVQTALPQARTQRPSSAVLNRLKEHRFEGTQDNAHPCIEALAALGCSPAEHRVLDWGSGWGARAWQLMAAGYRVTGFDPDAASRDYAVSQMGVTTFSDPAELDSSYDVFLCMDGLQHALSVKHIIREARRLVRSGGLVLFLTSNGCEQHRHADAVYWLKHRSLLQSNHLDDGFYSSEFSSNRVLLSSSPHNLEAFRKWADGDDIGVTKIDDLKGESLLCAIRL